MPRRRQVQSAHVALLITCHYCLLLLTGARFKERALHHCLLAYYYSLLLTTAHNYLLLLTTRFKARALHYCTLVSAAREEDWIIHLDEESRFNTDTVAHCLAHCLKEHTHWRLDRTKYAAIGQGVILYNVFSMESTLCALADTIRVGDDFGKFALQYRAFGQPLIGMHGSFVVCQNKVELEIGFDHGMEGSITEDTFFAMYAAPRGVQVKWCFGHMYEQSPFNITDFAKQRCRWYAGLWLCCRSVRLPFARRLFLGLHVSSWAFCPLLNILTWVNITTEYARSYGFRLFIAVLYTIPAIGYLVGFLYSFSPRTFKHGLSEFIMLLFLQIQLIPVFAVMEAYGIVLAVFKPALFVCIARFKACIIPCPPSGDPIAVDDPPPPLEAQESASNLIMADLHRSAAIGESIAITSSGVHLPNSPAGNGSPLPRRWTPLPTRRPRKKTAEENKTDASPFEGFRIVQKEGRDARHRFAFQKAMIAATDGMPASPSLEKAPKEYWTQLLDGATPLSFPIGVLAPDGLSTSRASFNEPTASQPLRPSSGGGGIAPAPTHSHLSHSAIAGTAHEMLPPQAVVQLVLTASRLEVSAIELAAAALAWVAAVHARESDVLLLLEDRTVLRLDADAEQSLRDLTASVKEQVRKADLFSLPLSQQLQSGPEAWYRATGQLPLRVVSAATLASDAEQQDKHNRLAAVGLEEGLFTLVLTNFTSTDVLPAAACLRYDAGQVGAATAAHWVKRLAYVCCAEPELRLGRIRMMSALEEQAVVIDANCTRMPFPSVPGHDTIHAAFAAAVEAHPDAIALIATDGFPVSYSELGVWTDRLSHTINSLDLLSAQNRIVALIFERSVAMLVAIFGVLKSGGAYLPLEPDFPRTTTCAMIEEARCALCLIGHSALSPNKESLEPRIRALLYVCDGLGGLSTSETLSGKGSASKHLPSENFCGQAKLQAGGDDMVYVMYTSGTTGKPKGVVVCHSSLLMRTSWMQTAYPLEVGDEVPFKTQYIFGVSEWEIFFTLTHGGTLLVLPTAVVRSPTALAQTLLERRVAVVFLIPSHLDAVLDAITEGLFPPLGPVSPPRFVPYP